MSNLDIKNFTRTPVPVFPFARALSAVLPGWEMSLVFAGEDRAQKLNVELRGKDYIPNVLSYISGVKSGEIIICPSVARKEAPAYDLPYDAMVGFLFIHGLLHLKGYRHGATMDTQERALLSRFTNLVPTNGPKDSYRN